MPYDLLMIINSWVNALIYFLKGYADIYFKKNQRDFEPDQRKGRNGKDVNWHITEL